MVGPWLTKSANQIIVSNGAQPFSSPTFPLSFQRRTSETIFYRFQRWIGFWLTKVPWLDESFLIRDDFLYFQLFIRRLVQPKFATKLSLKTDYNLRYLSEIESSSTTVCSGNFQSGLPTTHLRGEDPTHTENCAFCWKSFQINFYESPIQLKKIRNGLKEMTLKSSTHCSPHFTQKVSFSPFPYLTT